MAKKKKKDIPKLDEAPKKREKPMIPASHTKIPIEWGGKKDK